MSRLSGEKMWFSSRIEIGPRLWLGWGSPFLAEGKQASPSGKDFLAYSRRSSANALAMSGTVWRQGVDRTEEDETRRKEDKRHMKKE